MDATLNIVLCGPESCGKSTIGKQLSKDKHVPYTPEYARIFLERHGTIYTYESLDQLWREHRNFQLENTKSNTNLQLLDTDLLHYQIWFDEVFQKIPEDLMETIALEREHRYLLFYPDIPWEPDPLRENPHDRERLFERYRHLLEQLNRPYQVVRGSGQDRYQAAVSGFEKLQKA